MIIFTHIGVFDKIVTLFLHYIHTVTKSGPTFCVLVTLLDMHASGV